jgi:hypothetical protein
MQRRVFVGFRRIWISLLILICLLSSSSSLIAQPSRQFTGRKITLDFKDADIRNILRLIAEVSDLNIVIGNEVKGRVTIKLVEVPWEQALEVILQLRIPGHSVHPFRIIPSTDSDPFRPPIPEHSVHFERQ